jgi:serine/threonine-protein kinase
MRYLGACRPRAPRLEGATLAIQLRERTFFAGLGSVPADPDEARGLLQRRLIAFSACFFALGAVTWGINAALNTLFFPAFAGGRIWSGRSLVLAGAVVGWGLLWATLRSRAWSARALSWADLAATPVMATVLGIMVVLGEGRYRPEMVMSMALVHLLVLRAAIVPSTALRSAVLAAVADVPIIVAALVLHTRAGRAESLPPAASIAAALLVWGMMCIATTAMISFVIYGLHQRVREVMRFGQYTLQSKLGEGGMGVVYQARHALLRRPTAIKVLCSPMANDLALARFEREVQSTAKLSHPNIVSIFDFGRSADGVLYYAMEYVDGIDLERLVRRDGPQPEGRVRLILMQAADALAEAHDAGLIHRDVKPSNMILRRRSRGIEQVKLVDFGLVKETAGSDTMLSGLLSVHGTPLYMAPEAIKTPGAVDARTDLYALGAVGYYLLTGLPVFAGETVLEVCGRHVYETPVPPSKRVGQRFAPGLEDAILACLAKSAEARPRDAATLLDALRACDDCLPWSAADARRWWTERAPSIRDEAALAAAQTMPLGQRFAVDLGGRS